MSRPVALPASPWDFRSASWPQNDCVAAGADLAPSTLIDAYRHGLFPMPENKNILWWSPLERGVLRPEDLHITRSLRKSVNKYSVHFDTDFEAVIDACADPSRPGSWIDSRIRSAYVELHHLGWAHSVETRDASGRLVGGLYGLSIGHLFAGESMFHHATDASKVALVGLVEKLVASAVSEVLIDTQWQTPHLATLGVRAIDRATYLADLPSFVLAPQLDWTGA